MWVRDGILNGRQFVNVCAVTVFFLLYNNKYFFVVSYLASRKTLKSSPKKIPWREKEIVKKKNVVCCLEEEETDGLMAKSCPFFHAYLMVEDRERTFVCVCRGCCLIAGSNSHRKNFFREKEIKWRGHLESPKKRNTWIIIQFRPPPPISYNSNLLSSSNENLFLVTNEGEHVCRPIVAALGVIHEEPWVRLSSHGKLVQTCYDFVCSE